MNDLVETLNYENNIIRRKLYNNEYYYVVCDVLKIIYEEEYSSTLWKKLKNTLELKGFVSIYNEIERIPLTM